MAFTHHRVDRLDRLRAKFPGWRIFQTASGRCWAWAKLTWAQWRAGCLGVLEADTFEALEAKLAEQSKMRAVAG